VKNESNAPPGPSPKAVQLHNFDASSIIETGGSETLTVIKSTIAKRKAGDLGDRFRTRIPKSKRYFKGHSNDQKGCTKKMTVFMRSGKERQEMTFHPNETTQIKPS
jgi:hypothetical protein